MEGYRLARISNIRSLLRRSYWCIIRVVKKLIKAVTRDDRKIRLYSGARGAQSGIQIYSASGRPIHNIKVTMRHICLTLVGQRQNTGPRMVRRRAINRGHRGWNSSMLQPSRRFLPILARKGIRQDTRTNIRMLKLQK
jgi:hypothetical protein